MVIPLEFVLIENRFTPVPPTPTNAVEDSARPTVVMMLEPAVRSTDELTVIETVSVAVSPATSVTVMVSI